MRFACEQCQTKYTIPDERVRGKILKIRCKNCNCQITISEGGVRTARPVESWAASAQATRQPRASRPAIGLKWNHASPVWASRHPQEAHVTGAPAPSRTARGVSASGPDGWSIAVTSSLIGVPEARSAVPG